MERHSKRSKRSRRTSVHLVNVNRQLELVMTRTINVLVRLHEKIRTLKKSKAETSNFDMYWDDIETAEVFRGHQLTVVLTVGFDGVRFRKLTRFERYPIYVRLGVAVHEETNAENALLAGALFTMRTSSETVLTHWFSRLQTECSMMECEGLEIADLHGTRLLTMMHREPFDCEDEYHDEDVYPPNFDTQPIESESRRTSTSYDGYEEDDVENASTRSPAHKWLQSRMTIGNGFESPTAAQNSLTSDTLYSPRQLVPLGTYNYNDNIETGSAVDMDMGSHVADSQQCTLHACRHEVIVKKLDFQLKQCEVMVGLGIMVRGLDDRSGDELLTSLALGGQLDGTLRRGNMHEKAARALPRRHLGEEPHSPMGYEGVRTIQSFGGSSTTLIKSERTEVRAYSFVAEGVPLTPKGHLLRATGVFVEHGGMTVVADSLVPRIDCFQIFDEFGIHINDVELVDDDGRRSLPPYTSK
ncbi:unnamed protein product [Heligmosomoides polygyrus]|uniref:Integrase catalytic domain-containing protein n=1 Tax=Heligmosomoides polygyrus TaxID=6339 RepID=A0A183G3U1_HELPZ|nr:unnamed protein product [Heligmosomoides polygyrus]